MIKKIKEKYDNRLVETKKYKSELPSSYMYEISELMGVADENLLKYKNNLYGIILKIQGIDIKNYSEEDQEICYSSFADAIRVSHNVHQKYLFLNTKPVLAEQKNYIQHRMKVTDNEYLKSLLERQMQYFEILETMREMRTSFVFLYHEDKDVLCSKADSFISSMSVTQVSICDERESADALRLFLNYKWEMRDDEKK